MSQEINYLLENNLINHLKPVQPNPEFISKLGDRLLGNKGIKIENPRHGYAYLFVSIGLFLGAFLIWILRSNEDSI